MAKGCLTFTNVTFAYPAGSAPILKNLTIQLGVGWTGIIGPNGGGKTTLLRLACGELRPTFGSIRAPQPVIYCPQRTDDMPQELSSLLTTVDSRACKLRGRLGLGPDWNQRWDTLSHGERKRAQIAVALWQRPRLLALDEPTNHIDADARRLLLEALRLFSGTGLLVSHDRDLLDGLCRQCWFVESTEAVMRPGGYSQATELRRAEQRQTRQARAHARKQLGRLKHEAIRRARQAQGSHRQRSKRGLSLKDHDRRARRNQARVTGKDGQAGRGLRQLDGRLRQAENRLSQIHVTRNRRLGVDMGSERSRRDVLLRLPRGTLELGDGRTLIYEELEITPDDRIALTGPNGAGKSTLVRHLIGQLSLPEDKLVYLPQEIDRSHSQAVLRAVRDLPKARLGDVLTAISQLGSHPERLLETEEPSPGELRKIILALGLVHKPYLIIMDEPTNHLDLPSIECVETALYECHSALLLVSHDHHFLQRLARTYWRIAGHPEDPTDGHTYLQIQQATKRGGTPESDTGQREAEEPY